ncbi:MAG: GNAT family N-acetyltransferase [Pseudobdellovibrionaceae bacterium]
MTHDLSLELASASTSLRNHFHGAQRSPVQYLGEGHIPMALHFIEAAREQLPDHQKHFLKPKSEEALEQHLDNGAPLLGILSENDGMMAFGMVSGAPTPQLPEGHAVIQSVCSGGKGLGRVIVSAAEEWARANYFPAISAKVSQENAPSLAMFNACGFHEMSEGYDQQGDYTYYVMTKQLGCQ